ncbi:UNVERIFIED_ORG: peptidase M48-like protein [Zoogloea ramigera]|uniref:M48 family metallopeptidase n=1 Tax=Duganella zoogloeoides TaxID=75659 RepID=A0ABZ0XWM6_9BURK|nr:M48 family metallopeptidase [Duganella zoogloeoides]WQH03799.1 M48 family metallopeptidase [Duganella zoogloeoides]
MDTPAVTGRYFDGKTSRLHRVTLTVTDGMAHLAGDVERSAPLASLRVSERARHAARKVSFDDGAWLEVDDRAAFAQLLANTGHRDTGVVRAQQSWRGVLLALGVTVGVVVASYVYVLPAAAVWVANALPVKVERQMGQGVLEILDKRALGPSKLAAARQEQLRRQFAALTAPEPDAPTWKLVFRSSRIGPNALALPSGDIVMTDELVNLLKDDQAVMAVLAHELGHLHRRHLTRRLVQSSAVAAATWVIFGDISAMLTALPTVALDMKYSRDAESEADDYAVAMLRRNGIDPEHMAQAFVKLGEESGDRMSPYLSSHPATGERIARIRAAR